MPLHAKIAGKIARLAAARGVTQPARITDTFNLSTNGFCWATVGSTPVKVFARTLDYLAVGDTIFVRKMTQDRTSFWAYDMFGFRLQGDGSTLYQPGLRTQVYPTAPVVVPPTPFNSGLFFCPGLDTTGSGGYELWHYDGSETVVTWASASEDQTIGAVAWSLSSQKLYIFTMNRGTSRNEVEEVDPVTGVVTQVASYNFAGGTNRIEPGAVAEIGGVFYIVYADFSNHSHLVRFDPASASAELVDGPFGFSSSHDTSGLVGEVDGEIYWTGGGVLRHSSSGDSGSFTNGTELHTVIPDFFSYYKRGFQTSDKYYLGGNNQSHAGLLSSTILSIGSGGTITTEFLPGDSSFYGPFVAPLWNSDDSYGGAFSFPYDDWPSSSHREVYTNASGSWLSEGPFPYTNFGTAATSRGPRPHCSFGGKLYALIGYSTAGTFGRALVRRDSAGVWSLIRSFTRYDPGDFLTTTLTVAGTTHKVQEL